MINDEGLIKKSAVLKLLKNLKKNRPYANLDTTLDVAAVNVRKMPTADVVEVVRCQNCEKFEVSVVEDAERILEDDFLNNYSYKKTYSIGCAKQHICYQLMEYLKEQSKKVE